MSIRSLTIRAGPAPARSLIIALPGLHVGPEDFVSHGLFEALQARARIDVIAPALEPNDYFGADFGARLRAEIMRPAAQAGYHRIAILALSLGAFGALRYAAQFAGELDGLILLAPFLGNPGTVAEVERAGGLAGWSPGPLAPSDIERPGLLWLKAHLASAKLRPFIHLGYGMEDRFGAGARLLSASLPRACVTEKPGGHDWACWLALWQAMLNHRPLIENLLG
jgi:pimeloyl-ACP methyl ester carboxylesterase